MFLPSENYFETFRIVPNFVQKFQTFTKVFLKKIVNLDWNFIELLQTSAKVCHSRLQLLKLLDSFQIFAKVVSNFSNIQKCFYPSEHYFQTFKIVPKFYKSLTFYFWKFKKCFQPSEHYFETFNIVPNLCKHLSFYFWNFQYCSKLLLKLFLEKISLYIETFQTLFQTFAKVCHSSLELLKLLDQFQTFPKDLKSFLGFTNIKFCLSSFGTFRNVSSPQNIALKLLELFQTLCKSLTFLILKLLELFQTFTYFLKKLSIYIHTFFEFRCKLELFQGQGSKLMQKFSNFQNCLKLIGLGS